MADALSRRYDNIEPEPAPAFKAHLRPDLSNPETDLSSAPRTLHAMSAVHNSFCDQVRAAQLSDPTCIALCRKLDSVPLTDPIRKTYRISDDQLLETLRRSKPRVVVPTAATDLRHQLLQEAHDTSYGAHLGTDKTYQRLSERWFWKSMWDDTHNFVRSCRTCIANKTSNQQPMGEARPLPLPSKPWVQVGLDISGPHVTSRRGNTWLLVMVDHFSKQGHFAAAPGHASAPLSAQACAEIFFAYVVHSEKLQLLWSRT